MRWGGMELDAFGSGFVSASLNGTSLLAVEAVTED